MSVATGVTRNELAYLPRRAYEVASVATVEVFFLSYLLGSDYSRPHGKNDEKVFPLPVLSR